MENSVDSSRLQQWFTAAEDATVTSRRESERARDYVDGKQLTPEQVQELKDRGQPPVVINRVRRKIEWLKGLEVQRRTDPRAFPRTPQHQQGAEAATDAIRYVCDNVDWDTTRSDVYENMLVEGFGGCEVIHDADGDGDPEIRVNHYPWDRLFYDPHSRRHDFSDARYKGAVLWMDQEDFEDAYPKAKDHVGTLMSTSASETYDDKPTDRWIDFKRKRVRVVLIWFRHKNEWHFAKFIKDAILEEGKSPYVDEKGRSVCPLIMGSAFVGRDLDRYGLLRDMFDPQDEVNKRRSKALFGVTSRQTMSIAGALNSVADMKLELSRPDGHIEITAEALEDAARVGMRPFEILPNNDQISGQFDLLQEAKNEIDMLGANSALAGEGEANSSGRAVMAKQQGGLIEIASLNDRLHQLTREVYRQIWMRIRQFWKAEKWIRVTDDDRNVRFVGLNRPVTLQEHLSQMPPEQVQQIALQMGLRPGDPRLGQVVSVENRAEDIDVDIVLEEVPDQVTLAGETFEQLVNVSNAQPGVVPADILIEAAPGIKRDIKDKLMERMEQQSAQQGQMQGVAMQAKMAEQQAGLQKTQSETAKNMATAQKTMVEASMPRAM